MEYGTSIGIAHEWSGLRTHIIIIPNIMCIIQLIPYNFNNLTIIISDKVKTEIAIMILSLFLIV